MSQLNFHMTPRIHYLHPRHWYIELLFVAGIFAVVIGIIGAYWDIGWHFDYGRDGFWSPPHLFIYASIGIMALFFLLCLIIAGKQKLSRRAHVLFVLIILGIIGSATQYIAAPIDELWHRLYGIEVQIMSFPHLLLIFGGALGNIALIQIIRYHVLHERRRFLIEKLLIPFFSGFLLAGLLLMFAESEFATLPAWSPVTTRPLWVYPFFGLVFGTVVCLVARRLTNFRWAATMTIGCYTLIRAIPIAWNWWMGMHSIPVVPPFLLSLFGIAIVIDLLAQKQ